MALEILEWTLILTQVLLYTELKSLVQFQVVALHPQFSKSNNKQFVTGGNKVRPVSQSPGAQNSHCEC